VRDVDVVRMSPDGRRWWALAALSVAVLVVGLDLTILNVALPTLASSLRASTSQLQWFVDSYSLVLAALLLPAGILADRLGRKRLLLVSVALFAASSAACAYAGSPAALVVTRAVLGGSAAVVLTVSLSMLTVLFPADEERQRATSLVMGCTMLGYPLGPVLGGWLLDHFWWGSVFLINVPIAVVALGAITAWMPESRRVGAPRLDGGGVIVTSVVLSSLGLTAITYGVIDAGQNGWTGVRTLAALAVGTVCLIGFIVWEGGRPAHHREALVDLKLFRSRLFTWGTALATLISFALFGLLFAMPQYFEDVIGLSPLSSGVHLLPFIGGFVVGAALATALAGPSEPAATPSAPQVGPNLISALGFAILAGGLFLGAATDIHSTTGWASLWFVVAGSGLGVALPATMNAALSALSPERAGVGSGLIMACRQVGATIGVAVLGTVMSIVYRGHLDVAGLPAPIASLAREGVGTGDVVAARLHDPALGQSVHAAFVTSLDAMLRVCGAIAIGSTLLSILFLRARAVVTDRARRERTRASRPSQVQALPGQVPELSGQVALSGQMPALPGPSPPHLNPARGRQDEPAQPAPVGSGS
jgi:DHA2 family multidrug resistance protein-like MFS transporter